MHLVLNLTEPEPRLRSTARVALAHPWLAINQITPFPLIPANEIKTPLMTDI